VADNLTEEVTAQAATSTTTRTPSETFVDQYEIDGTPEPTPEPVAEAPATVTNAPPSEPLSPPPRDPASGRFVKPDEAAAQSPHSPRLVRMAKDLGLDDGEIASFPVDRLEEVVYHLNKQALSQARQSSIERTIAGATERGLGGQQPDPSAPAAATTPAATEDFDLGIDETQYDPGLIAAIKKMGAAQEKKIKDLESRLEQVNQREAVRANETMANRIDRAFTKHETHLGKGKGRELEEDSRDYQRRIAVLAMVDRNKSKQSLEAKIDLAVKNLYGEPAAAPARKPATVLNQDDDGLEDRRREWANGGLARPTQRQPSDLPNGTRKAEKSVAAKLAELDAHTDGEVGPDDFLE
jgi:hypothetical protein